MSIRRYREIVEGRQLIVRSGMSRSEDVELVITAGLNVRENRPERTILFRCVDDNEAIAKASPKFLIALGEMGYTEGKATLRRVIDTGIGIPDHYTIGYFLFDDGDMSYSQHR